MKLTIFELIVLDKNHKWIDIFSIETQTKHYSLFYLGKTFDLWEFKFLFIRIF